MEQKNNKFEKYSDDELKLLLAIGCMMTASRRKLVSCILSEWYGLTLLADITLK